MRMAYCSEQTVHTHKCGGAMSACSSVFGCMPAQWCRPTACFSSLAHVCKLGLSEHAVLHTANTSTVIKSINNSSRTVLRVPAEHELLVPHTTVVCTSLVPVTVHASTTGTSLLSQQAASVPSITAGWQPLPAAGNKTYLAWADVWLLQSQHAVVMPAHENLANTHSTELLQFHPDGASLTARNDHSIKSS